MADTPSKREVGLMGRKHLSSNDGMLFKFPRSRQLSFWMRNTYIPLDIAFLDDGGMVLQIEEMVPLSTRAIVSNHNCKYALEVNHGWFRDNELGVGSTIGINEFVPQKRYAQIMGMEDPYGDVELMDELDDLEFDEDSMAEPDMMEQEPIDTTPQPDVVLNRTFRELLDEAELRSKNLVIMYQKKDGYQLPPKVISPPFLFESDEHGRHDAIVKAWDEQDAGWKSFLIDNIMDLEYQDQEEAEENLT